MNLAKWAAYQDLEGMIPAENDVDPVALLVSPQDPNIRLEQRVPERRPVIEVTERQSESRKLVARQ